MRAMIMTRLIPTLFLVALSTGGCARTLRLADGSSGVYSVVDAGQFNPSPAVYFMDGFSSATVRVYQTGEQITFDFHDSATSISASAPILPTDPATARGLVVPTPEPLKPIARLPKRVPEGFRNAAALQLLQVVSMNMRSKDGRSSLLIGLPYAERFPRLFFNRSLFSDGDDSATSYGAVASLTDFDEVTGRRTTRTNGYPARSAFAIYHILETPMGTFFNKKPTVMELQPDRDGKLALSLPPIPFMYRLVNGPIPLYDVTKPNAPPVAEITNAHHKADSPMLNVTTEAWPWHLPDLVRIRMELKE